MLLLILACTPEPLRDPVPWKSTPEAAARDLVTLQEEMQQMPRVFQPPDKPNIVVIVLDTVRADHLGVYGYDRETTPKLDAWSADARVYTHMQSNGAWTLPSHASLFTGLPPVSHGAEGVPIGVKQPAYPLPRDIPTVAVALRNAGYRTAAIAANRAFLHRSWGLFRGFDLYLCQQIPPDRRGPGYVPADRINNLVRAFLKKPRKEPLFLFLNYMDAHSPWIPREGYVRDPSVLDRRVLPQGKGWNSYYKDVGSGQEMPEAARKSWIEAYDSELRYLDDQLGTLLGELASYGIDEDDYIFILSDHGEYLGEHSLLEHSKDLYQPVLHVPLLIRGPGYAPGRDDRPIQTVDVATQVLAAAGLPPLSGATTTSDLQVSELYWLRRKDREHRYLGQGYDRIRRSFLLGNYKLILGSDGSEEAYDLAADPDELRPVKDADWVAPLQARAATWLQAQLPAPPPEALSEAPDMDALRELGYIE